MEDPITGFPHLATAVFRQQWHGWLESRSTQFGQLNPLKKLTLREKTFFCFCLTLAGLIGVAYITSSTVLLGSLKKAEEENTRQTLQGVLNVLAKDQEAFTSRYTDWSSWDDTYTFIQGQDSDYIKSNLVAGQLANLRVNLVLYVNARGRMIYGTGFDFKTKQMQPIPSGILSHIQTQTLLLQQPQAQRIVTGILNLPEGPLLVTSQPILTSEGKGPVQGVVIFGRYLNAEAIANLAKITRLSLQVQPFYATQLPPDFAAARQALSVRSPMYVSSPNTDVTAGYVLLTDIYNQPALILRAEIPRDIYHQGQQSQFYLMVQLILLGLGFGAVSLWLLERFVLSRLAHLSLGVTRIRESHNLALRLPFSGVDEIASLTANINQMLASLEQAQLQVKAAFAQLAETNDELRIVVDQLQTEIIERESVEAALRQSEDHLRQQTQQLEQTLSELQQAQLQLVQNEKMSSLGQLVAGIAHEINNPINFIYGNLNYAKAYIRDLLDLIHLYQNHFPQLPPEVQAKSEQIDLDFLLVDLPKLLTSMEVGATRVREIIQALRVFSRLDEAEVKNVDLHEGLESTLMILQSRLKTRPIRVNHQEFYRPEIQILKSYGALPKIECYAGQLNQVFMNILVNAIDAIDEYFEGQVRDPAVQPLIQPRSLKEAIDPALRSAVPVTLAAPDSALNRPTISIHTETCGNRIVIRIADNGPGMTETVQQRLFDPFFTTKSVGKGTGMGMSISYKIVVEKHEGVLRCQSAPGAGAEFVIELPF